MMIVLGSHKEAAVCWLAQQHLTLLALLHQVISLVLQL